MSATGEWWTAPTLSESGRLIMVTGRRDINKYRHDAKLRYKIRVEVTWQYAGDTTGMPDLATSQLMEQAQDALQDAFLKDPVAVLTGIFTGDDERNWVFYTMSTNIFGRKLNEALADLPVLPLEIYCENDAVWAGYDEMAQAEVNID
ncbi:MAG: DUF695 domain-containing protein [Bacteroides sp.]|nr:DUF695 domain-containing protein [Bacteroides sp.]MCM1413190.1 DUF695 domain-containing protein [Bacteroides sp.]MCM1472068.1 DUF695 domain-containing protein [Bacteroides sp.]